jgi:RNA polymerase sigma factor (sigma-70 family)
MMSIKITEKIYDDYKTLVRTVAGQYAKRYHMVDRDDIEQELWMWFITHPKKTHEWIKFDPKEGDKLFARSLRNAAHDFCQKEKSKILGYSPDDNYYYDKTIVEQVLPYLLKSEVSDEIDLIATLDLIQSDLSITNSSGSNPAEHGNWIAYFSDISRAFNELPEDKQNLLRLRYMEDFGPGELATQLHITSDAARMKVSRALKTLINKLVGRRPLYENDSIEQMQEEEQDALED